MCENNGRYNIYLNTKGSKGNIDFDLKEMFKYINGGTGTIGMKTTSKLVKSIDKYVQEFNSNNTWRRGAMTLDMLIQENCELAREEGMAKGIAEGRAKGIAEGRAEGIAEGRAEALAQAEAERIQTIKTMYENHISAEMIAKCTGLNLAEVAKILSLKNC